MNNLILRAITGTVFVAVLVGCLLFSQFTFGFLFLVLTAFTINELVTLLNKRENVHVNRFVTTLSGVYLFLSFFCFFCLKFNYLIIFVPYLILLVYTLVRELYVKEGDHIANLAFSVFTQTYVALPFALLCVLASLDFGVYEQYNPILPLSIFIFIWCNDTGAYCIGSMLGKHRLFERISPKKSWEGSIGGGITALIAAAVLAHFFQFLNLQEWMGLALVIVIFGTWGDLVESLIKRQMGVKDSGNFLPGHGGLLDRFDSTLLAVPVAVLYLYFVMSM